MAEKREFESYITGAGFENDLAEFGRELVSAGMSEVTAAQYVRDVRHCEAVLGGDRDPRAADEDVMELLSLRLSHISKRMRCRYLRAWGRFVMFVRDGSAPNAPYRHGRDLSDDMVRFRKVLEDRGVSRSYVESTVKFVRHCWRFLGDLSPEDVDEEVVWRLDGLFRCEVGDNMRLRYLRALGSFIQVVTGRNPYRELTVPDRSARPLDYIRRALVGGPCEEELGLYIGILEHRGLRPTTIVGKVRSIQSCMRRLEDSGYVCRLDEITPETISYLATVMDDLKETTVRLYLRNLGLFLEFLTGYNPVADAEVMWNDSDLVISRHFISDEDWGRLLDHADPCDRLILMLGGTMGLRRAEIADLRLDDIRGSTVTIRGKGHGPNGKVVAMNMPESVRRALADYLPVREGTVSLWGDHSDGRVLVSGRVHPGEAMTPDGVGDAVSALARRAGVECSTHCLRRYYCTRLYRAGVDPDTLCQMMRHERFDTTRRCYIQPDSDRILEAQRALLDSIRT